MRQRTALHITQQERDLDGCRLTKGSRSVWGLESVALEVRMVKGRSLAGRGLLQTAFSTGVLKAVCRHNQE